MKIAEDLINLLTEAKQEVPGKMRDIARMYRDAYRGPGRGSAPTSRGPIRSSGFGSTDHRLSEPCNGKVNDPYVAVSIPRSRPVK